MVNRCKASKTAYMSTYVSRSDILSYLKRRKFSNHSSVLIWICRHLVHKSDKEVVLLAAPRSEKVFVGCCEKFYTYSNYKSVNPQIRGYVPWKMYTYKALRAELDDNIRLMSCIKTAIISDLRRLRVRAYVTSDTTNTLDFLILEAVREEGIPVVYIEHGLMTLINTTEEITSHWIKKAKYFDYYFCWSERRRQDFIRSRIASEEQAYVCGYQNSLGDGVKRARNSVLFVGESFGKTEGACRPLLYDSVAKIYSICKEQGIEFHYKKHPKENSEELKRYFPEYKDVAVKDLISAFEENYIVIGARTSAVLEAAINGNFVIQLVYDIEIPKNFIHDSVWQMTDVESQFPGLLRKAITREIQPKEVNEYEVKLYEDPVARMNELMDLVMKR